VPAGGSTIVEFKLEVPGTFILVDHSLFRAFNKGALGMLKVSGPENLLVYSGKEVDAVYLGSQAEAGAGSEKKLASLQSQMKEAIAADPKIAGLSKEMQMEKGRRVYMQTCFACHQPTGLGLPGVFPPLAKSDYLMADRDRSIRALIKGLSGPITVNGKNFAGVMPPVAINDDQVANVLTYIRNSWGNTGDAVTIDQVRQVRAQSAHQ
jgi:nitrite reductase (NO-forming)